MHAGAQAADYVCGKGGSEHEIAKATASAFVLAVASASVECEAQGNAKVSADAYAKATAKANVWLSAYAEAFASASCAKCEAYASSWGFVQKDVFLKAVAKAKASVCCFHFSLCATQLLTDGKYRKLLCLTSCAFISFKSFKSVMSGLLVSECW